MTSKYEFDAVRWLRNIAEVQSHRAGAGAAMLRENMLKCAWEIELLRARVARLEEATVHIYNSGYHAGHHDTVEGGYVDIHPSDMDSYHAEEVSELLAALAGEE